MATTRAVAPAPPARRLSARASTRAASARRRCGRRRPGRRTGPGSRRPRRRSAAPPRRRQELHAAGGDAEGGRVGLGGGQPVLGLPLVEGHRPTRTSSSGTTRPSKASRTVDEAPMAARASGGEADASPAAGGRPRRRTRPRRRSGRPPRTDRRGPTRSPTAPRRRSGSRPAPGGRRRPAGPAGAGRRTPRRPAPGRCTGRRGSGPAAPSLADAASIRTGAWCWTQTKNVTPHAPARMLVDLPGGGDGHPGRAEQPEQAGARPGRRGATVGRPAPGRWPRRPAPSSRRPTAGRRRRAARRRPVARPVGEPGRRGRRRSGLGVALARADAVGAHRVAGHGVGQAGDLDVGAQHLLQQRQLRRRRRRGGSRPPGGWRSCSR